MLNRVLTPRQLLLLEILIAIVFCFIPLLFNNPYRINIFLSWEGAYRISEGQMPFRDFSLPMGYGYWIIPAVFFKIFGPYMFSLIKAQVFVNFISIAAFRSILAILKVKPEVILFAVLVFCMSYVSKNFWPWYNHSVVVFELVGLACLIYGLIKAEDWKIWLSIVSGSFFLFFSFFTKQDVGGMAIMIGSAVMLYDAILTKSFRKLIVFALAMILIAILFIAPLIPYDFMYWFNHGQPPHESRLVLIDFLNQWIGWAYWEKFFLLIIVVTLLSRFTSISDFLRSREEFLLTMICTAMVLQGMVVQVTSPVPPENEVFFYAFGFAFLFANWNINAAFNTVKAVGIFLVLIVFWWTGIYWRNIQRFISAKPVVVEKTEKVNATKYRVAKEFKSMEKLYLAEPTLEGIHRIMNLNVVKERKENWKVLNMTELTSLAYELKFNPPIYQPMWYHQGVSIFQKEIDVFCNRIKDHEFDLILFQSIPHTEVVNFFPDDIKRCLDSEYQHEFTFLAPRTPEESFIHVYTRKAIGE
ncbi:MAG: hypothetical protein KF687_13730 [Cyclobacteriaceae bacterium]|nr:hypothetical protein [Cyclobacteriaceae bacterium]